MKKTKKQNVEKKNKEWRKETKNEGEWRKKRNKNEREDRVGDNMWTLLGCSYDK